MKSEVLTVTTLATKFPQKGNNVSLCLNTVVNWNQFAKLLVKAFPKFQDWGWSLWPFQEKSFYFQTEFLALGLPQVLKVIELGLNSRFRLLQRNWISANLRNVFFTSISICYYSTLTAD